MGVSLNGAQNSHTFRIGLVGQNPSNSLSCISGAKNFKDKPLASTAAEESLDGSKSFGGR